MSLDNKSSNYNDSSDNTNNFQIKEFFNLIWINKYWILLSIIISTCIAVYKVYRMPRLYGSTAELIVLNSNSNNYTGTGLATFSDIQGMRNDVNMYNEMEVLKSPYVMEGVVKQLNLNTTYTVPGFGYDIDIYGNTPVLVNFINVNPQNSYELTITKIDNNQAFIENLKINDKTISAKPITIPIGKYTKTPIGELAITKSAEYKEFDKPITVKHEPINSAARKYSSRISAIHGAEYTSIIKLNYKDVSEQRSIDILNTLMDVYNETWIKEKNKSAVNTSNFISERLAVLEKELNSIDQNISNARSSNQMPDFNSATQNLYTKSINYDNKVFEASNQLNIATYLRDYINLPSNTNNLIPSNSGLINGAIESQIQEYNKLLLKRDNLLENGTETNPIIAELNNNLKSMRLVILQSLDNLIATNEIQLKQAVAKEQSLIGKVSDIPEQQKEILSIERQQKVKENLYLYLLEKREENELTGKITVNNTRLIKEASSIGPVAPVRTNYVIAGFGIGLLIPLCLIFIYMMLNTKVHTKADLAELAIPFIGEIPLAGKNKRGLILLQRLLKLRSRNNDDKEIKILVKEKNRNHINEAFRMIRTSLDFMTDSNKKCNVIMTTSFNPGSGKSFISLNLASTLALKDNKRVLVIDLDLRRASLSKFIDSPIHGLSSYLTNKISNFDDIIIKNPKDSIIDILPIGAIPPNPSELLLSERYDKLIDDLKEVYDYIILDCPPLGIVADTSISSRKADMSIFIIRAGLFDKSLLSELSDVYNDKRLPNMAIILNGVSQRKNSYYGRKGHNYYID